MIKINTEALQNVCDGLLRMEVIHTSEALVCYYPKSISLYSIRS